MASYQFFLWEISPYLVQFLDDRKALAKVILAEALKLSKQLNASRHAANALVYTTASSIILGRHTWLRSTDLSPDTHTHVELFEGLPFFFSKTNEFLKQIKKNCLKLSHLG